MLADALTKGMTSPHMVKYMTTGIVSVSSEEHPIHSRFFQRTINNAEDKDLVDFAEMIKLFWAWCFNRRYEASSFATTSVESSKHELADATSWLAEPPLRIRRRNLPANLAMPLMSMCLSTCSRPKLFGQPRINLPMFGAFSTCSALCLMKLRTIQKRPTRNRNHDAIFHNLKTLECMVRYLEDEYWYFQENPSIVTGTSEDVSILALSDQLKVETPTSPDEPMPRRSVPSSGDLDASTLLAESPTAKRQTWRRTRQLLWNSRLWSMCWSLRRSMATLPTGGSKVHLAKADIDNFMERAKATRTWEENVNLAAKVEIEKPAHSGDPTPLEENSIWADFAVVDSQTLKQVTFKKEDLPILSQKPRTSSMKTAHFFYLESPAGPLEGITSASSCGLPAPQELTLDE